jgi:peptidoglycan-associated lipoprotein
MAGPIPEMPPGPPVNPTTEPTTIPGVPGEHPSNPPGDYVIWIRDYTILAIDTVYFAYDSSVVRESEKSKVSAVADYLKSNPNAAVEVQGNCDERGTQEYNRALGERRALALREELISLGAEASRVDTISFGKDRPAQEGHDESAWSKNRRGEFAVEVPPM